ncbi:hypothetical protein Ahy_A06g028030 [Arachis hypogaea]|uniref:FAR1 domain-containing protein n=1 Tax=Arachis hypogaea TaxID=3818 RepID=A0A445CQD0_ARAHY|nr:hypothetical protein Ahy_A06g028030 [Arachis hypogaea]
MILYVVDEQFVPKVGMTFKTLEEARKFYKDYSKLAGFSMRIRNTTRKGDEIKNQLITCSREEKWKSNISLTLKTKTLAGINCPTRIYRTIKNNEKSRIRPCKTYQSLVSAVGGHCELHFIIKDVRNYITREVRNIFE